MRVVQVSTLYPPEFVSGGTLVPHRIARGLQRRGHEVFVFAGSAVYGEPVLTERRWEHEGVPVHAINVAPGYWHGVVPNFHNRTVAERFDRYLADVEPDIVHFHCVQALGADILTVPRARKVPSVLTMHDGWFICARQFMFVDPPVRRMCPLPVDATTCDCVPNFDFVARRRFLDRTLESVDRILVVSAPFASLMKQSGIPSDKLIVCENGLPPIEQAPRRASKKVRFGYLGGPDPCKGASTIAAAMRLIDQDVVVELHGIDPPAWKAIGGGWPDSRVRLRPRFAPAQLPRIMANLDVLLVTSLAVESFSIVTREAFQCGVPVIASRTPGPEGIIRPGENGFLFDRDDAASLAEAMRRFVEDPRLLAAARAAASATVIRSVNEQVAQVESIYRELRSGASPHAVARLPRSVLFLAGMTGAPYRYRVAHLMQQLRALGIRATARFHHDEEALALAGEHEIVILNRVPWDIYVERIIRRARTAGALVVFGVDDLVFDPGLKIAALDGFSRKEVKIYRRGLRLFRRTLGACDALLGSTPALAEAARRIGKPAFVQPNTLDEELIRVSEAARVEAAEQRSRCQDALVRIGYFSGSNAHDGDFAVAARALARVLAARPRTCLVVGGHLQLPRALSHFRERIERLPFVPWRELPAFIAHIDINIAPLHTPSAFNDAKSALKWFEAAACGVPTIASPTASFRAAIRHGENGFLAENAAEWETALLSLVDDADLRTRIAEAARADALSEHGPARGTAHFAETLRQMLPLARLPLRALPKVTAAELDAVRARGISVGRAAFEPEDRIPGPSQPQWNGVTPNLTSTVSVYQALFFPDGLLTRIDFLIGTYGRIHRHDLVLRIIDPGSGIEVARSVVPAERACDNTWFSFDMGAVPTREGRQMLLVLEAPNAPRRRGPSIYCHHVGWPLGAGWAGAMHGFNLTYRTWFHPPDDAEADSNLAGKGEVSQPSAPAPSSGWAQQLEERLVLSENRLAHIGTQPSGLQAIAMRTKIWRLAERFAEFRAAPGPSLPAKVVRRSLALLYRDKSDPEVDELMETVRSSVPYRAGRHIYRRMRNR